MLNVKVAAVFVFVFSQNIIHHVSTFLLNRMPISQHSLWTLTAYWSLTALGSP